MMNTPSMNRARLRWRCRRGMLELDLLLQGFLDKGFEQLDATGQGVFVRMLELPDQTLHEYLMGMAEVREREFADVVERIRHAVKD
jgi:antitoxin CptB